MIGNMDPWETLTTKVASLSVDTGMGWEPLLGTTVPLLVIIVPVAGWEELSTAGVNLPVDARVGWEELYSTSASLFMDAVAGWEPLAELTTDLLVIVVSPPPGDGEEQEGEINWGLLLAAGGAGLVLISLVSGEKK